GGRGRGGGERGGRVAPARLGRRNYPQPRGAPPPAEETPYRAHALETVFAATAIDHGHEALRQVVDRRDERDAHDQPIEAVEDERSQTRFDEKAEQENHADNNGEPEKIGDAGC